MSKTMITKLQRSFESSYRVSIGWAVLWGLVALVVGHYTLPNTDCAWLLYAAQRMVNGDVLYADFYETNPPLIVWINAIPALTARGIGVNPVDVFPFFVVGIASLCLWVTLHEIRRHPVLSPPYLGNVVFAALAQISLGCSLVFFGQREHLFWIMVLPYIVQTSSLEREPTWGVRQLVIAVLAALGFALKPYFLVIWAMGEVYNACAQRQGMLLFRRTNWVIGTTLLGYGVSICYLAPDYVTHIMPLILLTYGAFTADHHGRIIISLILIVLMYLLPVVGAKLDSKQRPFILACVVWMVAAAVAVGMQHKGWINHYYLPIAFGTFMLSGALAFTLQQWKRGVFQLDRGYFSLLWAMGFITFILPFCHMVSTRSLNATQEQYIQQLAMYAEQNHSEGKPFYVMSFHLGDAFPAANILPMPFPFHFHHLWSLPAVLMSERSGEDSKAIQAVRDQLIRSLVQDFSGVKPALVMVNLNTEKMATLKDFDFVAYFRQNPDFAAQWEHYSKIGEISVQGAEGGEAGKKFAIYSRNYSRD